MKCDCGSDKLKQIINLQQFKIDKAGQLVLVYSACQTDDSLKSDMIELASLLLQIEVPSETQLKEFLSAYCEDDNINILEYFTSAKILW